MNNLLEQTQNDHSLMNVLMTERIKLWVSQTELAARMGTDQPSIVRMERGQRDPRISTIERYAASLGKRIIYQLVDA
jgi:predicted transcriptional regulator